MAERDALADQLRQAQQTFAALRRRLELREEENTQLRYALESRSGQPDTEALRRENAQLRAALERAQSEADQAESDHRSLTREARELTARLTRAEHARDEALADRDRLRARLEATAARPTDPQPTEPDAAGRVQRLAADLANLRRRRQADIDAAVDRTRVRLLSHLADVRDSLQRAVDAAPDAHDPWANGLRGVLSQLDGHLRTEGVELVGQVGEAFDPACHEALATGVHPEGRRNAILQVVRPGLRVPADNLLIRPAQVIVSA